MMQNLGLDLGSRWLAIAGPVSSYTWELFSRISQRSGVRLEVFHRPPDERQIRARFAHDSFRGGEAIAHDWGQMSPGQLLRAIDISHADAIVLFGTRSRLAMADALLRRPRRCPVVFVGDTNVVDVFPDDLRGWSRLLLYRGLAQFVTEAWTLGRSNEQAFRLLGFRRFRTLPFYSVNYAELGTPRGALLDTSTGPFRLLTIARLAPEKNLEALIRAVSEASLRQRVTLSIVGDGPARGEIERLLVELEATHVRLLGSVPHANLGGYLDDAHALVIPSRFEPWGNVVTEALGMGIPVLATPTVGAASSSAGRYGGVRLTDGADERGLARGLQSFLDDYASLAISARDQAPRVRSVFDVAQVAERMIKAIGELRAAR